MKILITTIGLWLMFVLAGSSQTIRPEEPIRFLALGDSYTIGQGVAESENWPSQLSAKLLEAGLEIDETRIIAQTGWRTDQLISEIDRRQPLSGYNLVSLLIGVNNQFQGRSTETYAKEFEELLQTALNLVSGRRELVFVLSIPDYAFTPFGNGNAAISQGIDEFNAINRQVSQVYGVTYIDITPVSRFGLQQTELVASDGLHPSGLMYSLWITEIMKKMAVSLSGRYPAENSRREYPVIERMLTIAETYGNGSITVYDAGGRRVFMEYLLPGKGRKYDLRSLNPGIFIICLQEHGKPRWCYRCLID